MRQSESNFLNMVQAVVANLRADYQYWAGEAEIVSEFGFLENELARANDYLVRVSGLGTTGYTSSKNNTLEAIVKATYKLCRRMCVLARRRNDVALYNFADHSENSLMVGNEKEVVSRCLAIVNKAETMVEALSAYKVTPDGLSEIRRLAGTYKEQLEARSTAKAGKSVTIQGVSEQIGSLTERLTLLDDLIESLVEDEEAIARYKASRTIVNAGVGKTAKKEAAPGATT